MPIGDTQAPTPQGSGGSNFINSIMGSSPVGAIAGGILGMFNDRRQIKQQERLQNLQMQGQRAMGIFNYNQQMKLWENTNYPAQVEQMKKAGLNPAMIYGMGGSGGATTNAQPGNVTGGQAPSGGHEIQDMSGMGMQRSLLEAQKRVLETQADKNEAEANKTKGVDTTLGNTQIDQNEIKNKILKIDLMIKDKTSDEAIDIIGNEAQKSFEDLEIRHRENLMNNETYETQVKTMKIEMALKAADVALREAQTKTEFKKPEMMKAEMEKWIREGVQTWAGLGIENLQYELNKWIHDVKDSVGLGVDAVKGIAQGIIFKGILNKLNPGMKNIPGFMGNRKGY